MLCWKMYLNGGVFVIERLQHEDSGDRGHGGAAREAAGFWDIEDDLRGSLDPRSRIQPLSQFDGYRWNPSQVYGSLLIISSF